MPRQFTPHPSDDPTVDHCQTAAAGLNVPQTATNRRLVCVRELQVRPIDASMHLGYVDSLPSASFLQLPSWARVKAEWGHRSVGWFAGPTLVGAALVLTRAIPGLRRTLAYIPEGPIIDWRGGDNDFTLVEWLDPLLRYLKSTGSFQVKIGPPVAVRSWDSPTLKAAIAASDSGAVTRLGDVEPSDVSDAGLRVRETLRGMGWVQRASEGAGFGDVQPRYVFQIALANRTEAELFSGFNQLWRRNVRKAEKMGVEVTIGTREDLPEFHRLYVETAHRDNFIPRGEEYFRRMWDAMTSEDPDRLRLYIARFNGEPVAATTMVRVGDHAWYSYGASSAVGREARPSNAIQWAMMRDSLSAGCRIYDMRGISDTLDPDDPLFGLIRFKLGTGGYAQEYVGEWDYPLRPAIARAFDLYLRRNELMRRKSRPAGREAAA